MIFAAFAIAKRCWPAALAIMLAACGFGHDQTDTVTNTDDPNAGQRIYRNGILPTGEPLTAIVTGDVPVLGTQFSCGSCHGRSGMGAAENTYIVPPIAGQFLFAASPQPARPAYDLNSLARLLREGITPGGRQLNALMPRYQLSDDEVADLAVYLKGLSSGSSPGVDNTVIRFATVITDDVSTDEREALLAVLNTFVEEKNRQTRLESERRDRGSTPASRLPPVHRDWVLEEWSLTGPGDTWDQQLEQHYRDNPVFAMLSGLSNRSWDPIGRFCERKELPCLLPSADLTVREDEDFHTLYFSRGLELEADLIANHISMQPVSSVVQVYCASSPPMATERLRVTLLDSAVSIHDLALDCSEARPQSELAKYLANTNDMATILWLNQEQVAALGETFPRGRVYLSATLLRSESGGAIPSVYGPAFVAHPFRLPGEFDPALARFSVWAKTRGVELSSPRHQSEAFFACLAMKDAIAHIGRFFIRDFVLDRLDHAQSIVAYLPYYPRPTLGPRQRFVNKGGYVLPVVNGQPDTTGAEWILP